MQLDNETLNFLKEREEKLGAKIKMRTYALFYLCSDGEKREYGVFLYTDGSTFIFEDFYRPPTFLGIELKKNEINISTMLQASRYGTGIREFIAPLVAH